MGNRRVAAPALTAEETQRVFAEDDAAQTCPSCGSVVRPQQEWCTLCLHVLRAPEPEPQPEPAPAPEPVRAAIPVPDLGPTQEPQAAAERAAGADPDPKPAPSLPPEVEAAATALLEQLAIDTRNEGFTLPSYLQTKGQKAIAVGIAMSVLSSAVLLLMTVFGAFLH
jgi:hypothetical protein